MKEKLNYIINTNTLFIRYMQSNDLSIMAKWLRDPMVLEFYGDPKDPYSLEMVTEKYLPRIKGEVEIVPCIVEYEESPIGFIQYYRVENHESLTFGIDQFIGEPSLWGQGIGTTLVSVMLRYLFEKRKAESVQLDTHVTNKRAIRCYEKCGFKKICNLPDERILMECKNDMNKKSS